MSELDESAVEALAASWASIDGKLEAFGRERLMWQGPHPVTREEPGYTGHYEGYVAEAEEMIARLRKRGFDVLPYPAALSDREGER